MTETNKIRKTLILAAAAIFIIAAIGIGYTCLKPHVYPTELNSADSLLEINAGEYIKYAESAFKDRHKWNKTDNWYYRLLCLKSKIKNGDVIKETDIEEANAITDHYKSFLADKRQLPYAYYYTGRAYSSRNDNPIAMDFYLKALDVADAGDLKLRSILNFQTGFILLSQSYYQESLPYFKKSYRLEIQRRDTAMAVYALQKMAYAYQGDNNDSCLVCYHKAMDFAERIHDKVLYNEILSSLGACYLKRGKYAEAKTCALPSLSSEEDDPARASILNVAAQSYKMLGESDSAAYYYHLLARQPGIDAKTEACMNLSEIYRKKGDTNKAFEYLEKYETANDSFRKTIKTEAIARMNAAYNYNSFKEKNLLLEKKNALMATYIIITSLIVTIGVIGISVRYRRLKRRAQEQHARLMKFRKESREKSEEYMRKSEERIEQLRSLLTQTKYENEEIRLKYENAKQNYEIIKRKIALESNTRTQMMNSDIYKVIEEKAKKSCALSDSDFKELESKAHEIYPDFKSKIYDIYPLSLQDFRLCLLIKVFNFNYSKISELLARDHSTISKAVKKLQMHMLGENTQNYDFNSFIKEA